MKKTKQYECQLAFTYEATDPVDAARQLIANIQNNPNWFVSVNSVDNPNHKFSVDTETGECEQVTRSDFDFDHKVVLDNGDIFYINFVFDTELGDGVDVFNSSYEFVGDCWDTEIILPEFEGAGTHTNLKYYIENNFSK